MTEKHEDRPKRQIDTQKDRLTEMDTPRQTYRQTDITRQTYNSNTIHIYTDKQIHNNNVMTEGHKHK